MAAIARAGAEPAPETRPKERVKILMVDDDPANLLALEAVLETLDEQLVQARSGEQALKCLLDDDFAVILLDVKMPDMDGFEAASLIRHRERSRHTPIIFLTGLKDEDYLQHGYYLGAVDFLFKPVVPEILKSKVSVFVELSRQRELLRRNSEALERKNRELERAIEIQRRAEEDILRLNAELEQRVAERTAELKWSNDELRQFAYVASHDLQEPLRTVSTYTQLLARKFEHVLEGDATQYVQFIVESVQRMHTLLSDMLTYSRVNDLLTDTVRTIDCTGVLQWVLMNLSAAIRETGATITHDPLPKVQADETQLVQLFQNLIGNAIKYRGPEPPRIHVSARPEDGSYVLSVRDNGIGIDPQYHDRVFGIFKRLHGREYPGTGIGLAICKKIVERHGGRIWVDSKSGEGATFSFTLPA
jgi:signal transduction histidine kinase